jgi:hypothetical protein
LTIALLALAGAAKASASPTLVVKVSPTTASGELASGYTIAGTIGKAKCEAGSDVLAGVYRCFAGNFVYDPCWALSASPTPAVVCLPTPWATKATQLDLSAPLEPSEAGPLIVWGIKLATGQRCAALQGAHGSFKGHFVNFACNHHLDLLGKPDRAHAGWTIRELHLGEHGHDSYGPVESIAKVWYGLGSVAP